MKNTKVIYFNKMQVKSVGSIHFRKLSLGLHCHSIEILQFQETSMFHYFLGRMGILALHKAPFPLESPAMKKQNFTCIDDSRSFFMYECETGRNIWWVLQEIFQAWLKPLSGPSYVISWSLKTSFVYFFSIHALSLR